MPTTPTRPRKTFDERGRAVPMTEEEVRARAETVTRGLDALWDMGDEDEQRSTLERLLTDLDEDRRILR